ncbi:MAG: hypothetical protein ACYDA2_06780 [Acidimicrobiales bacterium]
MATPTALNQLEARTTIEVEVDSRGRVSIGKLARGRNRFRVTVLEDGDILLTPVVSVSERELAFLSDPEAVAAVRRGIEQSKAGDVKVFPVGHFAELAAQYGPEEDD